MGLDMESRSPVVPWFVVVLVLSLKIYISVMSLIYLIFYPRFYLVTGFVWFGPMICVTLGPEYIHVPKMSYLCINIF